MSQNQKEREEIAQRHRKREAREQAEAAAAQGATATEEVLAPRTSSTGAIAKTGTGTTGKKDAPCVPYDVNDPAYHRINPDDMDDMVSMTLHASNMDIFYGYALPLNQRGPIGENKDRLDKIYERSEKSSSSKHTKKTSSKDAARDSTRQTRNLLDSLSLGPPVTGRNTQATPACQ